MSLDPELLSGNLHKCIGKSRINTFSWVVGCRCGFSEQVEHTFGRLQWHTLSGHPDDFLHTPLQLRVQSEDALGKPTHEKTPVESPKQEMQSQSQDTV